MRNEIDPYLASLYGTDTIQKTAQLAWLQKQAAEEGLNLTGLTREQLDQLAQAQLEAMNQQQEPTAEDVSIKEAQANLELADYMGRVMAHSYWQEIHNIEKTAAIKLANPLAQQQMQQQAQAQQQQGGQQQQGQQGQQDVGAAFKEMAAHMAVEILQSQGQDPTPFIQHITAQEQAEAQQQQAQGQQGQQQQYGQPQQHQQSMLAQQMGQQGQQQGQAQQGQQQRQQMGFRPQQQAPQQQVAQPQQQPQQQNPSAEAIKVANEMIMQQYQTALEEEAWKMLAGAGYQIQDESQMQQQGMQQGMQQQGMPQQQAQAGQY